MRISCTNLLDFMRNLDQGKIFGKRVHVNRSISERDEYGRFKDIYLQSSAVVEYEDETQALVDCGVFCGEDVDAADGGTHGSDTYDDFHRELLEYCEAKNVKLLPGILEI